MLPTELDSLLTGFIVCPELVMPGEWLPLIWEGSDDGAPFEDPADVQLLIDMVMARYNEIVRDLGRDKLQPIFDVDQRNGELLWEDWIEGFDLATQLRSNSRPAIALSGDAGAIDARAGMTLLLGVSRDQTSLMSDEINALCDGPPA